MPIPVRHRRQRLKLVEQDRITAFVNGRQKEELLLDIRGEVQKIHDLADPRRADAAKTGQLFA